MERPAAVASAVVWRNVEIFVPLAGVIDLTVERQRLEKEIGGLEKALGGLEKKLSNAGFLNNAPAEVVTKEREREREYRDTLSKLRENLAVLSEGRFKCRAFRFGIMGLGRPRSSKTGGSSRGQCVGCVCDLQEDKAVSRPKIWMRLDDELQGDVCAR